MIPMTMIIELTGLVVVTVCFASALFCLVKRYFKFCQ